MGFFSWLRDRIEDIKDFFSSLGRRSSYTGSVPEAVDVAKELNNFKRKLSKQVAILEQQRIEEVVDEFDQYIRENTFKFPELAKEVERRKTTVSEKLDGMMMNYINKRLSTNDSAFRKALEMQPGKEKKVCLANYTEKFITKAEEKFWEQLQSEMNQLYDDVSRKIRTYLEEQTSKLEVKERHYITLRNQVESGQLNLQELEDACIPAADAERCLEDIFRTAVTEARV